MTCELREEARRRELERKRIDREREELVRDLRAVAETGAGKRLLRWLIDRGRIFSIDYQSGDSGAYRAGEKAQSLRLWQLLRDSLSVTAFADIVLFHPGEANNHENDGTAETAGADCFHEDF